MENSESQDNEGTVHKVSSLKNLSQSDLTSKQLETDMIDTDLHIIGFKVQLDDNQVYSFTLNRAISEPTNILRILNDSNEVYSQEIIPTHQPKIAKRHFSDPGTSSKNLSLDTETINSCKEDGKTPVLEVLGRSSSACQTDSLQSVENKDRTKNSPDLELKIGSNCLENKDFEVHIKSRNDTASPSSILEQTSREDFQGKDQLVDVIRINPSTDEAHYFKYSKQLPNEPFKCAEMASKEVQTEKDTSDSVQSASSEAISYKILKEKFTETENFQYVPPGVNKKEKSKKDENENKENCQCSCGHKKQHDCVYNCCVHSDCENVIPVRILLGQSLPYLESMYSVHKCDYCRCSLNKSCSETTNNCSEKLKSDVHMQYCCKCGANAKLEKDSETSMKGVKKFEIPRSIELKSKSFTSLTAKEKISHQTQIEIAESLKSLVDEDKMYNTALKLSKLPKVEKVSHFNQPGVIDHYLNSFDLSKLARSNVVTNPIDIQLREKRVSHKEKDLKKGSRLTIPSETDSKVTRSKSIASLNLESYYSHSRMCPCSMCHSNYGSIKKNEKDISLNNSGGALRTEKDGSPTKPLRNTSPKIKPDRFDYTSKDGWAPRNSKSDEVISKKIEATKVIYLEKIGEYCESAIQGLNEACEIVNDHLLSLRPVNEDKVQKAAEILHKRWFEVAGSKSCDVLEVRNCIQYLKEFSNNLLKTLLYSVDNNDNNVLHFAFANSRFDVVDELLQNGFALDLLNKVNKSGNTPLMICAISKASSASDWAIVHKCFEYGDVNEKSAKNGQTPLMNAASCGLHTMVELLLVIGADPNLQDMDGSTALMYAAEHGHDKCVKSLMRQKDCDPTIKDMDGETACSIALSNGHKNTAVLIHMQALEKRKYSKNLYSTKRFIWTNTKKTTRNKTVVKVPSSMVKDLSWEKH